MGIIIFNNLAHLFSGKVRDSWPALNHFREELHVLAEVPFWHSGCKSGVILINGVHVHGCTLELHVHYYPCIFWPSSVVVFYADI